ncbi:MAG: MFS transporter, partial [Alphaproteobacteria bacterium]|nr:MFS transporter [Alphaproteobacteria bacterium]
MRVCGARSRRHVPTMTRRFPYAFVVVAVIFLSLLAAAGLRSTPAVLMVPWGQAFGWSRGTISFAAATGIFLFGLTGPFAAAAMQRFGVRRTMIAALILMSGSTALSLLMTSAWQLVLLWGVLSGIGTGCIANVLSATIANRWFVTNRGLVTGLFAASTSTGTLVFYPALSAVAQNGGWKPVVTMVALGLACLIPVVAFLLPEWPRDVGEQPFGADADHPAPIPNKANPLKTAFGGLVEGSKSRDFWLLAGTFFVCGFTTNGLVGTHMIALCSDHGLEAVTAGSLL